MPLTKELDKPYEQVLEEIPEALKAEGFGILTEIDVKETLKKKLDVDFRRYRILGACNPPLAHQALSTTLEVGVMLPCNVVVYERDGGGTTVMAVDPIETIGRAGYDELKPLAQQVRDKLSRVLETL